MPVELGRWVMGKKLVYFSCGVNVNSCDPKVDRGRF